MKDPLIGQKLPELVLPSSLGRDVHIPQDLQGHWTLLYFYPKDDTPGCTKQACNYRDAREDFIKQGVHIYGISLDGLQSHQTFSSKHGLNFPLLSDKDRLLGKALHVYQLGFLASRDTFLVDKEGVIQAVWRKVTPASTALETLQSLSEFISQ